MIADRAAQTAWASQRLKDVALINPEVLTETTLADREMLYVDVGNVDSDGTIRGAERMPFGEAPTRARRLVRSGDTIISTVRTYLRAIAHLDDPPADMVVSTGFAVLRPRPNVDPRFLAWAVRSEPFIQNVIMNSVGVGYPAIAPTELGRLVIAIPPVDMQRAIATYLDRETTEIERVLQDKRHLARLLRERLLSSIAKVAAGAASARSMRLRHIVDVRVSNIDKKSVEGHLPVALCNYTDVYYSDKINDASSFMAATATSEQVTRFQLKADDVLITKDSETSADIAISAHVPSELAGVVCGYHLAILRPRADRLNGRFLHWMLQAQPVRDQFTLAAQGVTRFGLRQGSIRDVLIPLPQINEQCNAVAELDSELEYIEALKSTIGSQEARLRERRAALITAAVTGQVEIPAA